MPYPAPPLRREIRSLTGVRGVAAVAVVLYHFANPHGGSRLESRFDVPHGYLAVDLFLILSGFVLAYNYSHRFLNGATWAVWWDFLIKRIARIYPPYICIMALFILKMMVNVSGDGPFRLYDVGDFIGNALLLTGWGLSIRPFIGPSWSVSAEMFCYAVFPLIVLGVFANRTSFAASLAIAVAGIVALMLYGPGVAGPLDIVSEASPLTLLRALCGFTVGVGIYAVFRTFRFGDSYASLMSGMAIVLLLAAWVLDGPVSLKLLGMAFLIYCLAHDDGVSRAVFGNRIVYFLGEISYSLYLLHTLMLNAALSAAFRLSGPLGTATSYWGVLVFFLAANILLAYVSYVFCEMKGRRLMLQALQSKRASAQEA